MLEAVKQDLVKQYLGYMDDDAASAVSGFADLASAFCDSELAEPAAAGSPARSALGHPHTARAARGRGARTPSPGTGRSRAGKGQAWRPGAPTGPEVRLRARRQGQSGGGRGRRGEGGGSGRRRSPGPPAGHALAAGLPACRCFPPGQVLWACGGRVGGRGRGRGRPADASARAGAGARQAKGAQAGTQSAPNLHGPRPRGGASGCGKRANCCVMRWFHEGGGRGRPPRWPYGVGG